MLCVCVYVCEIFQFRGEPIILEEISNFTPERKFAEFFILSYYSNHLKATMGLKARERAKFMDVVHITVL